MSIFISNAAYASTTPNYPVIGYHSVLRIEDITALNSLESRPARNVWSPDTATFWQGNAGANHLTLANPDGQPVNYVGIARHNLGSQAIAYSLQKSNDGIIFTALVAQKTVANDSAIVEYFDATIASFIRIVFSGAPIIAHVRMGRALVLERPMHVGQKPPLVKKVARITNGSENGQYLGQIITRAWHEDSCKQEHNSPDFVRTFIVPFINHCNGQRVDDGTADTTFFYAWAPLSFPHEIIYGWVASNIEPENQLANGMMRFSFDVHGVA